MKLFIYKSTYWFLRIVGFVIIVAGLLWIIMTLTSPETFPKNAEEKFWFALVVILLTGTFILTNSLARFVKSRIKIDISNSGDTLNSIKSIRRASLLLYLFLIVGVILFLVSIFCFISIPSGEGVRNSDERSGGIFLGIGFLFNSMLCGYKAWQTSKKISVAKSGQVNQV